jgi:RNA polymerase sporulation-specific sigma factor
LLQLLSYLAAHCYYLILYITNANSFPRPLTAKEEHDCFLRMQQGDNEAKNMLIEHNLRLVAHIIKN